MYIFAVYSLPIHVPINLVIFRDRNFVVGLSLIFMWDQSLFQLFLLPLFLQNVQDYPVLSAGWIVSVRGIGTMFAMLMGGTLRTHSRRSI